MRRSRNAFLIRLVTAVTLIVSLVGPLVSTPQVAQAAGTAGSLTIVKATNPNPDPFDQSFTFSVTRSGETIPNFNLKNGQSQTIDLNASNNSQASNRRYVVTEASTADWTVTGISCNPSSPGDSWSVSTDPSNRTVTITPPRSNSPTKKDITCTFTNKSASVGSLTINKITDPAGASQSFNFTATKGGSAVSGSPFALQDAGSVAIPLFNSGSNSSARTYVVTESGTTGWTLTDLTCSGANSNWTVTSDKSARKVTIVLTSNSNHTGNMTCTFTNTQNAPPAEPGLTPLVVSGNLMPGEHLDVTKIVTTPSGPPAKLDVLFLVDTTGSMQPSIDNVKANAANIMNEVRNQVGDSQFAVAGYRDDYDPQNPPGNYFFAVLQSMTDDTAAAQAGINLLAARQNGCDTPEGWINALWQVASKTGSGTANLDVKFRTDPGVTRVVVLIGDSSSWDPSPRTSGPKGVGNCGNGTPAQGTTAQLNYWGGQHTEAQDITALNAANIKVMSINVTNPQNANGLDSADQATNISNATGGAYLGTANYDVVADKIIEGLTNLPVNVKLVVDTCDNPPLSVTFDPTSKSVQPGQSATFTETVTVAGSATPGTYTCKVYATIDGSPLKDAEGKIIYETITINVGARTGTIKIVKDAVPNSTQSFAFTGSGAIGNFSLVDNGGVNYQEFTVDAGSYTVTETGVAGWDLTGLACVDPSGNSTTSGSTATINLAASETVICTYTNTQRGKIITKKVTDPASTQAFTFNPSWGDNFTLQNGQQNESGWLAPGNYSVSETVPAGWDLSQISCTVASPNGGTWAIDGTNAAKANITLGAGEVVTCVFTNTQRKNLTVSKTATGTFDRAYTWSIAKSIDETNSTVTIGPDGTATFNYNVAVNQTGFTDSLWKINGQITVTNPNSFDVTGVTVTDSFDGTTCTVTDGTNVTVPANGSVQRDYTCEVASKPDYSGKKNTATATWNAIWALPSTSAMGQADVTFNVANTANKDITVKDNKVNKGSVELGTLTATNGSPYTSHIYEYALTFEGVDGKCTDYSNSAWIDGTAWRSGKTVTVCVTKAPTVTKTVNESYTRTYDWTVEKDADATRKEIASGNATFNYTVKATHDAGAESLWTVTGTISVTNNNFATMTNVVVSDDILDDTIDSCTIAAGGATTIGSGETKTYTYTCTWGIAPAAPSQTNKATVTWDGGSASYETGVDWTTATVTKVNDSVTVSDSLKGSLGTATVGVDANPTKTFTYDYSFAGVSGACTDYLNTATASSGGTTLGSDGATVTVCVGANLSVSKTASGSYNREYQWDISKTATDDRIESATGSAEFEYKVTVTQTGVSDSSYSVSGTITVSNPNTWQGVTVDITDAIGAGWSCTVTDGDGVLIEAGETNTRPYTCMWDGTGSPTYSGTNTATVTWDKDAAHTTSNTATGTADFTLGGSGATNKTVTVTDPLATPITLGTVTGNDSQPWKTQTFTYTHTFTGDPAGVCTTHDNTATLKSGETTLDSASKTVTQCVGADLTVSKTVNESFDRTYKWKIDKSVDGSASQTISGSSATFNYKVDVTPDGYTDSNWKITGTITVSNSNAWQAIIAVVTDAYPGGTCTIENNGAVTVPASGTADLDYTCIFAAKPEYSGTNTATVQWSEVTYNTPTGTATGTADVAFTTPTTETNRTVDVYDSAKTGKLGTSDWVSGPFQYTYSLAWAGTPGKCTTHDNTATLKAGETVLGSDKQTVTVCTTEKLGVSKTANPALTRTWAWGISKAVDKTSQNVPLGGSATFNYTVNVTHDAGTDSGWKVSGKITVTNPNFAEVSGVSVTDQILDELNANCAVTGGSTTIAAGGQAIFDYTCTYSAAPAENAQTNKATVTWTSLGAGATTADYSLPFNWTSPTVTRVNDEVTVTDSLITGAIGTVKYTDDSPTALTYSKAFTPTAAGCTTYDNTATYTAKDDSKVTGSSKKSVQVCAGVDLTVSKTAEPAYHRTVTWGIQKDVDQSSVTIAEGGTVTSNYTVGVTKTVTQSAWVVTGTITVSNPNGWAIAATIGDAIDNGGTCSITSAGGANVSVPAASGGAPGTASVTYTCMFTSNPGTGTNTATATWDKGAAHTPTGSATGTKGYDFADAKTTTTGLDTVTVSDPLANPTTKPFSASGDWKYSAVRAGVAGACTVYGNTATIVETKQTDSANVTICVGADLTVTKSASGTFDREYTWKIDKSVDKTSQNVPAGTNATFNYGVTATQTGIVDSTWKVTGKIWVHNPNWQTVTVASVTDAIGAGWSCPVTGGTNVAVGAGQTVALDYTCTLTGTSAPSPYSGTNTATATWDKATYSTPTGSASGSATYTLNQAGSKNKTVDVYDNKVSLATPVKLGTVIGTDAPTWASQTFNYSLDLAGVAGVCTDYTNTATLKVGETSVGSDGETVTVCGASDLSVAKTANTAFVRTHSWTINKTANPTDLDVFAGDSGQVDYTVTVDKTTTDSAWVVSGTITVTNPNRFQAVVVDITDTINNGGVCTVPGGTNVTVPAATADAPGSVSKAYTCTYAAAPAPVSGTNTATATWNKDTYHTANGTASGTATADFGAATITTVGPAAVNVTDTNGESWGPIDSDKTLSYTEQRACSADPADYVNGHYQFTHQNTAEITETEQSKTATVTVDCYAPVVSGAGVAEYTRAWDWDITKTADVSTLTLPFWQPGTINYTVTVTATPNDGDLTVSGTLTIVNPNPSAPMTATVAGNVNGVAATFTSGVGCTITNGSVTIPAGGTATCAYTAALGADFPAAGTATASATVTVGSAVFGASTTVAVGEPTSITDETITVNDTLAGNLGTISAGDASPPAGKTWNYPISVGPFPSNTNKQIDNTATYTTNDTGTTGSDDATVTVKVIRQEICDCTQQLSYWVNMADPGGRRGFDPTWNLVGPQGANTTFFKSPFSFRTILVLVPRGNDATYYGLAQQYVVAELNLLHGASAPQEVVDAMYAAKVIFQTYTPAQVAAMSSSQRAELTRMTSTLSRFNQGFIGPGRCR